MIPRRAIVLPLLLVWVLGCMLVLVGPATAADPAPFTGDAITPMTSTPADATAVAPPDVDPAIVSIAPDQGVSVAPPPEATGTPQHEFLMIGHMGAPTERIENTLPSFARAIELGANAIETDLSLTKDGVLVHWHDWSPNNVVAKFRQLGKQGLLYRPHCPNLFSKWRKPVPELTLAQLREHFGYVRTIYGVGTKQPKADTPILTLDEFCKWAANEPRLRRVFFDVKIPKDGTAYVKPFFTNALRALKAHNLDQRAVFMVPQANILEAAKPFFTSETRAKLDWDQELPPGVIIHPDKFSAANKAIAAGVSYASLGRPVATIAGYSIYKKIVTRDLERQKKHNASKPATPLAGYIVWTIDKPEEMRELMKLGVQGILTNKPAVLRAAAEQP